MAEDLEQRIGQVAAHVHAATAELAKLAAEADTSLAWAGTGIRGCAHWLSILTGLNLWSAGELVRVGHALSELPRIAEAFVAGRLSFDKVRALTAVAKPADEHIWLEVGLQASGSQLARICRSFRRAVAVEDPQRSALQQARRRVWSWWRDEDGMLELYATLPPEEGRIVLNAIEAAVKASMQRPGVVPETLATQAEDPYGARRADGLVRIAQRWLADLSSESPAPESAPKELVVHVDLETLAGLEQDGRCHVDDGPALPVAVARRIGCDAELLAVAERNGVPVGVGRSRRVVSGRLRRLVQLRDEGCRYPGCDVPAADTEAHHVVHWLDHGSTELSNLLSLCRFHHHRHHDGEFRVVAEAAGQFRFETANGKPILVPTLPAVTTVTLSMDAATARDP